VKLVQKTVDRMAKLVEDLLDVSRLETGRLALEREEFDVAELLTEVRERMQVLSAKHTVEVSADGAPPLMGDRGRVDQVLTNLISNAIRYSPSGGWVRVKAERVEDQLHLSVADQGIGIPLEKQEAIFERFGQAHGARYGGLGLGLTIAHGIVDQHGGRMWVESPGTPGQGSVFHVLLPLQSPPPAADGDGR
jgi:signal transduction histidine kinase